MELIILDLLLAVSSSFIAAYLVLSRPYRRARFLALTFIGSSVWCFGYAMEVYYPDLLTKLFWAKVQIVGMLFTNVWPLFVAHFTGNESFTGKKGVSMIAVVPVITLGLLLTNDIHGLIFSDVSINHLKDHLPLLKSYGAGFILFTLYSYVLFLGSSLYAVKSLKTGAVDYLPKPFTYEELISCLSRGLKLGKILKLADQSLSDTDAGAGSITFAPCPSDYKRLGYYSWTYPEDEGVCKIGITDILLH